MSSHMSADPETQVSPTKPSDELIRRVCLGGMRDTEEGREVLTYLRWLERRPVMDNGQILYMGLARSVIDRILRVDMKVQPADECDILQRLECLIQERDRLHEALTLLWRETELSGNSNAKDYGWPKAREATLTALGKLEG